MTSQNAGWRQGAACVAALTFDVDAESPVLAEGRRYADHAMVMTHQAFGPLVGVPRILQMLKDVAQPATFFIPGLTAERYPAMVEQVIDSGHEIAHHSYTHRTPTSMTPSEERADFERALKVLDRFGITPVGHRAALWEASWQTPSLVAEYGLKYDSSLMDFDTPYRLETPAGTIAELPPHWSLDDWEQYAFLPNPRLGEVIQSPLTVADMWIHEIDAMRRHGAMFMLTCHPFLSGRAGRLEALRTVIETAMERGDVTFATCKAIAEATLRDPDLEARKLEPVSVPADLYPLE
ncbi:polysaccharide deacetylase [Rhodococcus sp. ACPA1]|uniref:polysaccharide deacetylase family protein n=1 Tax=Rhodococcus sp. ACPA1 TaxID=2028572 RepID=UPI000BB116F2|nr:polysaccharide deacetylase [Rhodococcus sp. ACPA1]PBC47163.1 polysaccharide deacetylase [Rhodococcus sp. ACPA1]